MSLNIKLLLVAPILTLVAACATTPQKGEFISIQQVAAENADKPWECSDYDPATDSCAGLSKWTIKGDTVSAQSLAAIAADDQVMNITMFSTHKIVDGRICGLEGNADVLINGERFKKGENLFADIMTDLMTGVMSKICGSYYRSGTGYYAEVTNEKGKVLPDFSANSTFFATEKTIRAEAIK